MFISAEVIAELSAPAFLHRAEALALAARFEMLPINDEVLALAELLIAAKVMPGPLGGDAVHVATAAYHGIEYLISWNVRHLANPNKRVQLVKLLTSVGRAAPLIVTPEAL